MKGWKTVAFNALTILLAVLVLPEVQDLIPAEYMRWVLAGVGAGNIILRAFTTTPIGKRI